MIFEGVSIKKCIFGSRAEHRSLFFDSNELTMHIENAIMILSSELDEYSFGMKCNAIFFRTGGDFAMKICQHCGSMNSEQKTLCSSCGGQLSGDSTQGKKFMNDFFQKEERKEKRKLLFQKVVLLLYFFITVPIFILCVIREPQLWWLLLLCEALFGGMYYLSVLKPKALFFLEHCMHVDNIESVEPSEWYYISNKIGGYLFLLFGMGMMIYVYCNL